MRVLLVFASISFSINTLSAQVEKRYIVKAGEIPAQVLPVEAQYVLPVFKTGMVYMRDGSASRQYLNYNIILGEMQFIGTAGDTFAIAEPATIKSITFDTLTFYYYDKNYLQVIAKIDSFKLAIKKVFIQTPYRTRGGYDAPTATSSITTYSSVIRGGSSGRLQVKKDVQFESEHFYFIGDKFNNFYKAEKKSFLTIFANKKDAISNYLRENNINFRHEPDLEKLLRFCSDSNK